MVTSINCLSLELVDMIVHWLDPSPRHDPFGFSNKPKIARYATISRLWQQAVDSILFRDLKLNDSDLENLPTLTPSRIFAVRNLEVSALITPYPDSGEDGPSCDSDSDVTHDQGRTIDYLRSDRLECPEADHNAFR